MVKLFKSIALLLLSTIVFCSTVANADILINSKNSFIDTRNGITTTIKGDFIVITLKPNGAGRYFYVDSYKAGNTAIWSNPIAAGKPPKFTTPSGIYKVYHKKRKHMSTKYPEPSGINNMNYSMFFKGGYAIHQGNPYGLSHGCIHLSKKDAKRVFETSKHGITVIITRSSYIPFLTENEFNVFF